MKRIKILVPTNMAEGQNLYEELGFIFDDEEIAPGQIGVILPIGWDTKKEFDNEELTYIRDNESNVRGAFSNFYAAEMHLYTRIGIATETSEHYNNVEEVIAYDSLGSFSKCFGAFQSDSSKRCKQQKNFRKKAENYLDKYYPGWKDPKAYWDVVDLNIIKEEKTIAGKVKALALR